MLPKQLIPTSPGNSVVPSPVSASSISPLNLSRLEASSSRGWNLVLMFMQCFDFSLSLSPFS